METTTYGYFLVPVLRQKLPDELRMIMSRNFKNDLWEITDVLNIFKDELHAKERCLLPVSSAASHSSLISPPLKSVDTRFSTMNLYQQQQSNLNQKHRCLYCESSEHAPSQCCDVTNVKARVAVL